MTNHTGDRITRKDFIKKTSAGLVALGFVPGAAVNSAKARSPEYRMLGGTGIKVSAVGFGATRTMEPILVTAALDNGSNFIDTGRPYFNGQNEVMIGKAVKSVRKNVIIQSKFNLPLKRDQGFDSPTTIKKAIAGIETSVAESLAALQTDYIDILLLRSAPSAAIIYHEAILEFFKSAKEKGQIRACGFSAHHQQVELVRAVNEKKFYDVVMVAHNHKGSFTHARLGFHSEWDQGELEAELARAETNHIGIVAMKTCSAGPYAPDTVASPSYEAALKWILQHSFINSVVPAMGNIEEITENVRVMF